MKFAFGHELALFLIALVLGLVIRQTTFTPTNQCISWDDCQSVSETVAMAVKNTGSPLVYETSASLVSYDTDKVVSLGTANINYVAAIVNVAFWYVMLDLLLKRITKYRAAKASKPQSAKKIA